MKCLNEFGLDKITEILNEIYDSEEMPDELTKSIFIALPKKPATIECEMHRTISVRQKICSGNRFNAGKNLSFKKLSHVLFNESQFIIVSI